MSSPMVPIQTLHSRTRVHFGPGGTMFVIVAILLLVVAFYSDAPLLYGGFGLLVGGLVVSAFVSWQTMRGITVIRVLPSHGVSDESTAIRYQITNPKRWMPAFSLVIRETWGKGNHGWKKTGPLVDQPVQLKGRPHGWVLHLGPNQRVQAEAPCWPLRRGRLHFEKIQIYSAFPFGVIRWLREFEQPQSMLVYPKLVRINRRLLYHLSNADPHGRKKIQRAGGQEEFFGLREYRVGDSLKMIDWKRTARTSKLISREMTQPSPPKITLVLDLTFCEPPVAKRVLGVWKSSSMKESPDAKLAEQAISLAASLICDAYLHGYQIGFTVVGVPCVPFGVHHSLPHRTRMLEALSQLDLSFLDPQAVPVLNFIPSVVIQSGPQSAIGGGAGTQVLRVDEMGQYVELFTDGANSALSRRVVAASHREDFHKVKA